VPANSDCANFRPANPGLPEPDFWLSRVLAWCLVKHAFAFRLLACFLSVTAATALIGIFEKWEADGTVLWAANGLLLAYLLLAPRWQWPAYLATGFLALILGSTLFHESWDRILLYNTLDLIEVITGAALLRRRSTELPRFTHRSYLLRFLAFGVLLGPAIAGAINALIAFIATGAPPGPTFLNWMVADGLGIAVTTPAFVAVFQTRFRVTQSWRQCWYYPPLLVLITVASFAQQKVPILSLIYPLLTLILIRLGLGYASLSMLSVAVVAGGLTMRGDGPFAAAHAIKIAAPGYLLQGYVASALILLYTVSMVLEKQRKAERRLQKIAALHALVTENSRDAIIISDFHGNRSYAYISAPVQAQVGWTADEFAKLNSLEQLHPEDRPKAANIVHELQSGVESAMIETRFRKRDGEYIWVESSLRLIRNPRTGSPSGILNIVRDITERKLVEQQLKDAYKAVETLAVTDALTGLANRRGFDQTLSSEWRRSLRDARPLSLLLIDVDLFKSYNDTYGHVRGDSCLKQIAEAALDVVARPGDMVARFGGEEFAVILPSTDGEGALRIAEEISMALRSRKLPHSSNPLGFLTLSIGCATMVPSFGLHSVNLVERADEALYKAKRDGRNQVCSHGIGLSAPKSENNIPQQAAVDKIA